MNKKDASHRETLEVAKSYNKPVMHYCDDALYPLIPRVADEVCERVRVLGENGGYIIASSHNIQSDTPLKNVLEMYPSAHCYREAA